MLWKLRGLLTVPVIAGWLVYEYGPVKSAELPPVPPACSPSFTSTWLYADREVGMQQLPKSLCLINDPRRKQKCVANVANSQNCFHERSQYVCGASIQGCVELSSQFASLHPETVPPGWVEEQEEELNRLAASGPLAIPHKQSFCDAYTVLVATQADLQSSEPETSDEIFVALDDAHSQPGNEYLQPAYPFMTPQARRKIADHMVTWRTVADVEILAAVVQHDCERGVIDFLSNYGPALR
jgi:hypothetical protein